MKTTILILSIALLLSLVGNWYQSKLRKDKEFFNELDRANSNAAIAGKLAEISIRDSIIIDIRKERQEDSVENSVSLSALKQRVATLQVKIQKLPKTVVYNPDSATVDSLRVAFSLKDSTINTQALMIMSMEVEKTGVFDSFHKEIAQLEQKQAAQVEISNQLQTQVVSAQAETRKEVRKRKFWRFTTAVGVAAVGVLLLKPD